METIKAFFAPNEMYTYSADNQQLFDLEGLRGRLLSSSYTPEQGQPSFEPMLAELERIFHRYQQGGKVSIDYDTVVYYGRFDAIRE